MENSQPQRIAFVINSLTGNELLGGREDGNRIYNLLIDDKYGNCSKKDSRNLINCKEKSEFQVRFDDLLEKWTSQNQLIFYFSGHGDYVNDIYCLKLGLNQRDFIPYENIFRELVKSRVTRAIIILDACYSGAATGLKGASDLEIMRERLDLPNGIAVIASSNRLQRSKELTDGSMSVFTKLFCDGIVSGLNGSATPDGIISIDDLNFYIKKRLDSEEQFVNYRQRPTFTINGADRTIWISKNISAKYELQEENIQEEIIKTQGELKNLYERTLNEKHPCLESSLNDLNWKTVNLFAQDIIEKIEEKGSKEELLEELKLYSPIIELGKKHLHKSAILCFGKKPELLYPQAQIVLNVGNPDDKSNFHRDNFTGSLSEQVSKVSRKINEIMGKFEFIGDDGKRHSNHEVIRELISNAVVHRNYEQNGTISISIINEEIQIKSPGNFPKAYSWNDFLKNEVQVSCPINPSIAYYLSHLLVFENIGYGFSLIRQYISNFGDESIIYRELPGPTTCIILKKVKGNQYSEDQIHEKILQAQKNLDDLPLDKIPAPSTGKQPTNFLNIPLNPFFLGRDTELKQLALLMKRNELTAKSQIVTVCGMGGVGKTQLVSEFCHRYGKFFSGGVYWFNFSNPEMIKTEIAACGHMDESIDLDKRVSSVLEEWQNPIPRLLIFENCEKMNVGLSWCPSSGGSRVIIITRQKDTGSVFGVELLEIGTLSRKDSIQLLHKFIHDVDLNDPILDAIANELGDLPLALHMAGNYLEEYRFDIEPSEYLEELKKTTPIMHVSMRNEGHSPTGHVLDLIQTFSESIEHVAKNGTNDSALQILKFISFFAPRKSISRSLLIKCFEDEISKIEFADGLNKLLRLGLIYEDESGNLYIHKIVADYIHKHFTIEEEQKKVVKIINNEVIRINESGYPLKMETIRDHLAYSLKNLVSQKNELSSNLLNSMGVYLYSIANYETALMYHEQALEISQKVLGKEHPNTASCLNNIGRVLVKKGKVAEAMSYYEEALEIRKKVLGEKHPDTATSLNNIGGLYQGIGKFDDAMPAYVKALAIKRDVLGSDHPDTARCLNNIGLLLQKTGNLVGANRYYEESLIINMKFFGLEHPETARSINNLGVLFYKMGDLQKAVQNLDQAIMIRSKTLGDEHPDTARSLKNMGLLLQDMGNLSRAEPYYEQALVIFEKKLGAEHPDTKTVRENLGSIIKALEKRNPWSGIMKMKKTLKK